MSDLTPEFKKVDVEEMSMAIVASRFNQEYVDQLLNNSIKTLTEEGIPADEIQVFRVPGANELPFAAGMLAKESEFDCILLLGLVLAGETSHHDVIAYSTASTIQKISYESATPIINGIIVVNSLDQAENRCSAVKMNRGREFALAGLEMAVLGQEFLERSISFDLEGLEGDILEWEDDEDWKS